LEDYLEAIYNISGESEVVRSKDIATSLGVAKPSVTGALKALASRGLVNYRPYGYVTLTKSGTAEAKRVARKHDVISSFFVNVLGVDRKTAQATACKAEHALGPAIISRLGDFSDFVNHKRVDGKAFVEQFRLFCSKKEPVHGRGGRGRANDG
jgi:DtxR family Mn-dependent transcriptional regulator